MYDVVIPNHFWNSSFPWARPAPGQRCPEQGNEKNVIRTTTFKGATDAITPVMRSSHMHDWVPAKPCSCLEASTELMHAEGVKQGASQWRMLKDCHCKQDVD